MSRLDAGRHRGPEIARASLKDRLQQVSARINTSALKAGRAASEVQLLAVSKTQPAAILREAYALGLRHFGENYLKEALEKQAQLCDLEGLVWHFIGPIQSNKCRLIAEHFDWVHSVDRIEVARRLNDMRPPDKGPLNVCIQVNVSLETTKHGILPEALPALFSSVRVLPRLRVRGLMTIPAPPSQADLDPALPFRSLRRLMKGLEAPLDTLSMGMSEDLELAIHEGATWVRVGTKLFGERPR